MNITVMAGLVPAIHVLLEFRTDVDARDKPGHDELDDLTATPDDPETSGKS
ncbi:MAG TPA: hypothetical protein VGD75_18880 [Bradyrhizobium sp.]